MKRIESPPEVGPLFKKATESPAAFRRVFQHAEPAPGGRYRHWDRLRRLPPPAGLSHEEWWLAIKMSRGAIQRDLPLKATNARNFKYAVVDALFEKCHEIDQTAGGAIAQSEPDVLTNPHTRDQYLISSLFEEAITSSQLEGASTTRQVAKEMLRSGREPRDRDERMILNNYRAMEFMRAHKSDELDEEFLLELHSTLTEGTLENPKAVGRFRLPNEEIVVWDEEEAEVLHRPPPAAELKVRVPLMFAFANRTEHKPFVHPVVRAILLHFWLAYDHPFVDGNGRTARALFYWAMLRGGYWLCEFISISRILKKARPKYSRSFLYTETDENDATYFILSQLDVIRDAIAELHKYISRKLAEQRNILGLLKNPRFELNHRQIALLTSAAKRPTEIVTIESHRTTHGISYQTARTDLLMLEKHGLLNKRKLYGKTMAFTAAKDLAQRLKHS